MPRLHDDPVSPEMPPNPIPDRVEERIPGRPNVQDFMDGIIPQPFTDRLVDEIADSIGEMNDLAVKSLVEDSGSATRAALDQQYVTVDSVVEGVVDVTDPAMAAVVETGDSATRVALDAAFLGLAGGNLTGPLGVGKPSPSHHIDIVADAGKRAVNVAQTISAAPADLMRTVYAAVTYLGTDAAAPTTAVNYALDGIVHYGNDSTAPVGTAAAVAAECVVHNNGDAGNEHAAMVGFVRYDMGTGFDVETGDPGRGWALDIGIHGAVGLQQEQLSGITSFVNNYYDGQPSEANSYAFAAVTKMNSGTAVDATHAAAETYPVGVGFLVTGASGTGNARNGFDVGFHSGGIGSAWETATARIGTGFKSERFVDYGLHIGSRHSANTGRAIFVAPTAGASGIGIDPVASGSDRLYPPTLTLARAATGTILTGGNAARGLYHNLFCLATNAVADWSAGSQELASTVAMGGRVNDTGPVERVYATVEGRKANGTQGNTQGVFVVQVNKNATGLVERLRIDGDAGLITISDGGHIAVGTTTGTKIGTATSQKLGFYNATPIVQPSGIGPAATDAASTQTLANNLRTALINLGLVAA